MMEDWGLQAVVGGCNNKSYFTNSVMDINHMDDNDIDSVLLSYPCIFESANELEELYKPFYPIFPNQTLIPSLPVDSRESEEKLDLQKHLQLPSSSSANLVTTPSASSTTPHASKYKRRKNQQKRVVLQVTAEALSSDVWAWRKYGQKPIKGSPYPRSYYRCSSSKGCLARKQVEQSCSDPGMFIITYTAEHSHSQPTRRNSLAGTNRNKPKSSLSGEQRDPAKPKDSTSSPMSSTAILSPTTPSTEEDEIFQQQIIKQETKDENGDIANEFSAADMIFSDDFFAGLEDLGGFGSDSGFYSCTTQQFPTTFCS